MNFERRAKKRIREAKKRARPGESVTFSTSIIISVPCGVHDLFDWLENLMFSINKILLFQNWTRGLPGQSIIILKTSIFLLKSKTMLNESVPVKLQMKNLSKSMKNLINLW